MVYFALLNFLEKSDHGTELGKLRRQKDGMRLAKCHLDDVLVC